MTHSLLTRSRDLRQRALATDAIPHRERSTQLAHALLERREAMQLLELFEMSDETKLKEFVWLESRVFELCTLATRGPNGHSWLTDLPQRENGSPFYQALRSLAKELAERTLQVQQAPQR